MARSKLRIAKEQEDENGYWTGDDGASGILPIARDTGRICLAWRNKETHTGDCWGTIGGAIQQGKTPEDSAVAEMKEETGYTGEIELHPAWVFEDGDFSYYNFVGIVESEFKLKAQKAHAWETDEIVWLTLAEILEDMAEVPEEYHPEFINLFKESAELIERFAGKGEKKTAAAVPTLEQVIHSKGAAGIWEMVDVTEVEAKCRAIRPGWDELSEEEQDEVAKPLIMDVLRQRYDTVLDVYNSGPRLTLYRALNLPGGIEGANGEHPLEIYGQPKHTGFGIYWAWSENGADTYNATTRETTKYVFKGSVSHDGVDWEQTFYCNVVNDEENEVRLKKGTEIRLEDYRPLESQAWQPVAEGMRFVTASKIAEQEFPQWIAVDLDGTLATSLEDYSDPTLIGPPIPAMIEKILDALEAGETVKVFTARMADKENADRIAKAIGDWTEEHIGERLEATNEKDPGMKELWDDKARGVIEGTGEFRTAAVDVQLENDCYDSHGGETFCTLRAKSSGNTVGFIDYSLYDGSVHLKMIEVAPEWQRQGVGTQLVEGLRKENPGKPIEWGGMTPDGSALKAKVHQPSDEPPNRLLQELEENRDKFVGEAQAIYNTWPVPMFDNSPGQGGLAENIAEAFEWAVGHYTSGYGVVKPEGDDYVVLCTDRNHTAKLTLPSRVFQEKVGEDWERKDGVTIKPEDIQIMKPIGVTSGTKGTLRFATRMKGCGFVVTAKTPNGELIQGHRPPPKKAKLLIAAAPKLDPSKVTFSPCPAKKTTSFTISAFYEGERIAWVGVTSEPDMRYAYIEHIEIFDTHPEWRGYGIGQRLYDRAISYSKKLGFEGLYSDEESFRTEDAEKAWERLNKRYPVRYMDLGGEYFIDFDNLRGKTASPDFGYSQFNDRDKDLSSVHFLVKEQAAGFAIDAKFGDEYIGHLETAKWDGPFRPKPALRNGELRILNVQITDETWKGTGLGQMLYDHAIEEAKRRGYTTVTSDMDHRRSPDAEKAWKRLSGRYKVDWDSKRKQYVIQLSSVASKASGIPKNPPGKLQESESTEKWNRLPKTTREERALKAILLTAGLPKNPPLKPETVYPEESNGWALFPDQRGENEAPPLDKLVPEALKTGPDSPYADK